MLTEVTYPLSEFPLRFQVLVKESDFVLLRFREGYISNISNGSLHQQLAVVVSCMFQEGKGTMFPAVKHPNNVYFGTCGSTGKDQ